MGLRTTHFCVAARKQPQTVCKQWVLLCASKTLFRKSRPLEGQQLSWESSKTRIQPQVVKTRTKAEGGKDLPEIPQGVSGGQTLERYPAHCVLSVVRNGSLHGWAIPRASINVGNRRCPRRRREVCLSPESQEQRQPTALLPVDGPRSQSSEVRGPGPPRGLEGDPEPGGPYPIALQRKVKGWHLSLSSPG